MMEATTNPDVCLHDKHRNMPRVLVIEDDVVQQSLLVRAARRTGHDAVVASSCGEAEALISTQEFACITLDLTLADGDGLDLMETLAEANYAGPVIVVSGRGAVSRSISRHLARILGIRLIQSFPKPVDLAAFRQALSGLQAATAPELT